MASVSIVFDPLIEIEINKLAKKHKIETELLSNYVIDKSSVTSLNQSNNDLLVLYNKYKSNLDNYFINNKKLDTKLKNKLYSHKQKYGWLNTGEKGCQEWEVEDFLNQLKNILSVPRKQTTKIKPRIEKELEKVIQININDNIASDLQIELDFLFQKYLRLKLGENYTEKILEKQSFEKIAQIIQDPKQKLSKKISEHRLAYPNNNRVEIIELNTKDFKIIRGLLFKISNKNQKILGRSACQGLVQGYVKIVRNLNDLANFLEGNILVAEKTQPSYVMIMKKAKAIVTDNGGITSHAAIISREFGIPCVVGTGNATKILKDGDYVQVDAFTGIVKKITLS